MQCFYVFPKKFSSDNTFVPLQPGTPLGPGGPSCPGRPWETINRTICQLAHFDKVTYCKRIIPAAFEIKENSLEVLVFLEILAIQEAPVGRKNIRSRSFKAASSVFPHCALSQ